jgi:hypothetical protein
VARSDAAIRGQPATGFLIPQSGLSRAAARGQHRSNMTHPLKRFGAAANLGELRRKLLKIYPLRFRRESVLSSYAPVGNLGGNFETRFRNPLNVRRNAIRLDFSPGHQFFLCNHNVMYLFKKPLE